MNAKFDDGGILHTLSAEQKLDVLLEAMAEVQSNVAELPDLFTQLKELTEEVGELSTTIKQLGLKVPPFQSSRFTNES